MEDNMLIKVKDNLFLTKYQMDVLDKFSIPYNEVSSNRELLYYLSEVEDDELEEVASEIADFCYYLKN